MRQFNYHILALVLLASVPAYAEIPAVLTDKIRSGDGIIDIFKDVSAVDLQNYLQGGRLMLGVDLNEDASGIESSTSAGVAIKQMELIISTTNGDFSFSEFYTNTTAMIMEAGQAEARQFYTLFGAAGGSNITSSISGFDLSTFDDVVTISNINVTGDITGARLKVTFLKTARAGDNESFFDYSAGFEEFAIITDTDARTLESANIGLGDAAPKNIAYEIDSPAGTPEPYWFLLLAIPVIIMWRKRKFEKAGG